MFSNSSYKAIYKGGESYGEYNPLIDTAYEDFAQSSTPERSYFTNVHEQTEAALRKQNGYTSKKAKELSDEEFNRYDSVSNYTAKMALGTTNFALSNRGASTLSNQIYTGGAFGGFNFGGLGSSGGFGGGSSGSSFGGGSNANANLTNSNFANADLTNSNLVDSANPNSNFGSLASKDGINFKAVLSGETSAGVGTGADKTKNGVTNQPSTQTANQPSDEIIKNTAEYHQQDNSQNAQFIPLVIGLLALGTVSYLNAPGTNDKPKSGMTPVAESFWSVYGGGVGKKGIEAGVENAAKTTAKESTEALGEKLAKETAKKETKEAVEEVVGENAVKTAAKETTEALGEKVAKDVAKDGAENAANDVIKSNAKGLIGIDFENYLTKNIGGHGSFKVEGREFDGSLGNRWWEAKSGQYWNMLLENEKKLGQFKSDMGSRLNIANKNGATYELFSNTLIPNSIKLWLDKKGIKYTEILD